MELHPFVPPWWLRTGHAQTLAAGFWTGPTVEYRAVPRRVVLSDGDVVVVHDDCPQNWKTGDRAVLLMHGLIGSFQSPLLARLVEKLTNRGVRVFRFDLRGCGAGAGLARMLYNAGCSQDLSAVVHAVIEWSTVCESPCEGDRLNEHSRTRLPRSFLTLFGVSLSGNILLKYLGEAPDQVPSCVAQAIAVNPPIDLARSVGTLKRGINRLYDRHFVDALLRDLKQRQRLRPDSPMPHTRTRPRRLRDFDHWYTAPISGYSSAEHYYECCSALQFLPEIRVPTAVLTSRDDPMVPFEMFESARNRWSPQLRLLAAPGGGHVGYIARRGIDPDEFWLDWRIVELVTSNVVN